MSNIIPPSSISQHICILSAAALLVYDALLTLDKEVVVIWRRRFSLMSALYIIIRYVPLLGYMSETVSIFVSTSIQVCTVLNLLQTIFLVVPYIAWAAFSALRMYALSDCNKILATVVFFLNAASILPDIYLYSQSANAVLSPPLYCTQISASRPWEVWQRLVWATRASLLLGEFLVLVWTLQRTYSTWHPSSSYDHASSLTKILLNNGVACFFIPFAMNLTIAILSQWSSNSAQVARQNVVSYRDAITSIVISRFLLQLGELSIKKQQKFSLVDSALTTHFMPRNSIDPVLSGHFSHHSLEDAEEYDDAIAEGGTSIDCTGHHHQSVCTTWTDM